LAPWPAGMGVHTEVRRSPKEMRPRDRQLANPILPTAFDFVKIGGMHRVFPPYGLTQR